MVTVNVIRELMKAVVESYREGIAWASQWSEVLDSDGDRHYPACLWSPPTVNLTADENGIITESIGIDIAFVDNHASDRTGEQRDQVYERMQTVAAHVWMRFTERYMQEEAIYQGVNIALRQGGPVTFTAIWDGPESQMTGCRMTVTVTSPAGGDWYIGLLAGFDEASRTPRGYEACVRMLRLPETVTGYREIRYPKMAAAREQAALLAREIGLGDPNKASLVSV